MKNTNDLLVRWMAPADKKGVLAVSHVYNESYALTPSELEMWRSEPGVSCEACLVMQTHEVIGYMIYRSNSENITILDIGGSNRAMTTMLGKLTEKIRISSRGAILMYVRDTELKLQLALKDNGFRAVSVLRHWFNDTGDDAYLFQKRVEKLVDEL